MANEVKLTLRVEDNGSLSIVASEAEKAAASTEKLDKATKKTNKSRKDHQKVEKGVAGITSNTTKAFSKQTGAISGGLVPAYAVLAANIFAITAAFGALQRAAQVDQLTQGLTALGQASGLAMQTLSQGLVEATGNALSLEEAMRSTALITSAGLDPSSIQRFGEVARNASVALGRDTADSLARLTRGVTKLEPELLDELGIMVRIDEASQKYAATLGKQASELSNFEKRQAFLNAALEEGERKFGAIGESVDSNPYDKLAATFQNLAKTIFGLVNTVIAPLASFLASSPTALFGVLTAFAGGVVTKMVPALSDLRQTAQDSVEATQDLAKVQLTSLSAFDEATDSVKNLAVSKEKDILNTKDYRKAKNGAATSLRNYTRGLKNQIGEENKYLAVTKKVLSGDLKGAKALRDRIRNVQRAGKINQVFVRTEFLRAQATRDAAKADVIAKFEAEGLAAGLRASGLELKQRIVDMGISMAQSTAFGAINIFLTGTFGILGAAAEFAAAAISKVAPIITLVSIAMGVLAPIFNFIVGLFKSEAMEKYEQKSEALAESQKELAVNAKEVSKGFAGQSRKINTVTDAYAAQSNILSTFLGKYNELAAAAPEGEFDLQEDAINTLLKGNSALQESFAKMNDGATTVSGLGKSQEENVAASIKSIETIRNQSQTFQAFTKQAEESRQAFSDFANAARVTTPYDQFAVALDGVSQGLAAVVATGQEYSDILGKLNSQQAALAGISAQKNEFNALQKEIEAAKNRILEIQEAQEKGTSRRSRRAGTARDFEAEIAAEQETVKAAKDAQKAATEEAAKQAAKRSELIRLAQAELVTRKNALATAKEEVANVERNFTFSLAQTKALQEARRAEADARIDSVDTQLNTEQAILDSMKENKATASDIAGQDAKVKALQLEKRDIERERATIGEELLEQAKNRVTELQNEQKATKAILEITNRTLAERDKAFKQQEKGLILLQKQRARAERSGARDGLDELEVLERRLAQQKASEADTIAAKQKAAELEFAMTRATMQRTIAELTVLKEKKDKTGESTEDIDKDIASLSTAMGELQKGGALFDNTMANIETSAKGTTAELQDQVDSMDKIALQTIRTETRNIKILDIQKKLNSELKKSVKLRADADKIQTDIAKLENTNMDGSVKSAIEAARIEEEARQRKLEAARLEHQMLIDGVEIEKSLMKAKFALLQAEMMKDGKISKEEAAVLNATAQVLFQQEKNLDQQVKNSKENLGLVEKQIALERSKSLINTGKTSGTAAAAFEAQGTFKAIADMDDTSEEDKAKKKKAADEALAATRRALMEGLATDFAALGPEGEIVSSVIQGSLAVSDAWTTAFAKIEENGGSWKESTTEVLAAVGASIGALSNMYAASSRAAIANVDQQIAAEKKRDGSSAKSVQKIAALEKKKEAMAKKAFEMNKKMQIASTIISTASAVMAVLSEDAKKGLGSLAIPMAVAVGAMGAAQVAMIAKQSFQGGSGSASAGASAPKAISMGKRSNTVDVSQRASGGELAYLRGARGMGTNANDFTPAFYGRKMRAMGGAVAGYTVGEQGPELFVPEVPGTIVPNDDIAAGQPINVNFNVQAIDSASFNDALTVQRGNIISIIREAANGYGEGFLEQVDIESLKMER